MGGIGLPELVIVFFIIILLFGASRLPQLAKSLGQSIKEFKKSINNKNLDSDTK